MPTGTYLHLDDHGATRAVERFRCAAGPAGWRYTGELRDPAGSSVLGSVDVVVDSRWRQLVVQVHVGGVSVQGGAAGDGVAWARVDAEGATDDAVRASGFTGDSPAFLVAAARLLTCAQGPGAQPRQPGQPARLTLVRLDGADLRPRPDEQQWLLTGTREYATDTVPLPVERYEVIDVTTGRLRVVHLAGDVVLDAPGLALDTLESPPTLAVSGTSELREADVGEEPQ